MPVPDLELHVLIERRMGIGIGTPVRITDLVESGKSQIVLFERKKQKGHFG